MRDYAGSFRIFRDPLGMSKILQDSHSFAEML